MIHRDIDGVAPGTVLAADVLGASGHVLARAGVILTPKQLRILKAHGITQITIRAPMPALPLNSPDTLTEPHLLEIFRHSNAQHPLIKELIRLCDLRTGRSLRGLHQHDH